MKLVVDMLIAGAMIYPGRTLGLQLIGDRIFMNNIHGQRLNVDVLKQKGSGYVGSHSPDFLLTRGQSFADTKSSLWTRWASLD